MSGLQQAVAALRVKIINKIQKMRKIHFGFRWTWTQQGGTTLFPTPVVSETILGIFVGH